MLSDGELDPQVISRYRSRQRVLAKVSQQRTLNATTVLTKPSKTRLQSPFAIRDTTVHKVRAVSSVLVRRYVVENLRELIPALDSDVLHPHILGLDILSA